jgi:hypothetical protein
VILVGRIVCPANMAVLVSRRDDRADPGQSRQRESVLKDSIPSAPAMDSQM